MKTNLVVVAATCPNDDIATLIAKQLVEKRLCACVNMVPQVQSLYRWDERIEQTQETLLLCKTQAHLVEVVFSCIRSLHPYEVPELVSWPLSQVEPAYHNWIVASTT